MKKNISLVLCLIMTSSILLYSQKIKVNEDAFSGKKTVSSSWQAINIWEKVYYRFLEEDNTVMFEIAWGVSEKTTYMKNEDLNLKFDNDEAITLSNTYKTISTKGAASSATFLLSSSLGLILKFEINEYVEIPFNDNLLTLIRLNYETINGKFYKDIEVTEGVSYNIQETYRKFKNEIDKD